MYDPIMRVLTVLEILQARDSVTGAELAERLEVDLRTVQRYIVRLKDLNIPVESSRGVGGAYRLKPGFRRLRRPRREPWPSWSVCCLRRCGPACGRWMMWWRSNRGRGWFPRRWS